MTFNNIYDIIYYSVAVALTIASVIVSVIQHAKQKNISKLQALYECIPNIVISAENMFGSGNGEKKKHFAMTELVNLALQSGTKYDYNELSNRLETVVKATKNVNVKEVEKMEELQETFQEQQSQPECEVVVENCTNNDENTQREMINYGTNN